MPWLPLQPFSPLFLVGTVTINHGRHATVALTSRLSLLCLQRARSSEQSRGHELWGRGGGWALPGLPGPALWHLAPTRPSGLMSDEVLSQQRTRRALVTAPWPPATASTLGESAVVWLLATTWPAGGEVGRETQKRPPSSWPWLPHLPLYLLTMAFPSACCFLRELHPGKARTHLGERVHL